MLCIVCCRTIEICISNSVLITNMELAVHCPFLFLVNTLMYSPSLWNKKNLKTTTFNKYFLIKKHRCLMTFWQQCDMCSTRDVQARVVDDSIYRLRYDITFSALFTVHEKLRMWYTSFIHFHLSKQEVVKIWYFYWL